MFVTDGPQLAVPIEKVLLEHSITITWPDGHTETVRHHQDVSKYFGPELTEKQRAYNYAVIQIDAVKTSIKL